MKNGIRQAPFSLFFGTNGVCVHIDAVETANPAVLLHSIKFPAI